MRQPEGRATVRFDLRRVDALMLALYVEWLGGKTMGAKCGLEER